MHDLNAELAIGYYEEKVQKGLEAERINQMLSGNKSHNRNRKQAVMRAKIMAARGAIIAFGDRVSCQIMRFFYPKAACPPQAGAGVNRL